MCTGPNPLLMVLLLLSPVAATAGEADRGVAVLAYHRFDPLHGGATTVTTLAFERQLDWLDAHGYRVVALGAAVEGLRGTGSVLGDVVAGGRAVAITVDDGHASVYTQLYPIVRRRHVPVTLFIYPSAISHAAYALTWGQLADMTLSGLVTVQSHTYWHPNFHVERAHRTAAAYRAFVDDQLVRSKRVLERRLGVPVELLAWPFGIVDADLRAAALRAGYRAAFGYGGGPASPGGDPFAIPRLPMSDADQGAVLAARLRLGPSVRGPAAP
ncbi:polysaccharide deacetylase [Gluconacetobacter johannae DSM 13595]|nr:polysaccharide deacetylase family protein [Gluconacetobacter johannae]GBQ90269.1 polysaccharide deacetylase [Gluconacetobacter johannae DSM 13595]